MRLDLMPMFQNDKSLKPYLLGNFRRIQELFDRIKTQPALPNTTGASLAQLETEVNSLKQRLRDAGLVNPQ